MTALQGFCGVVSRFRDTPSRAEFLWMHGTTMIVLNQIFSRSIMELGSHASRTGLFVLDKLSAQPWVANS